MIVAVIQAVIFLSFVIYIALTYGVLRSISHSWYELLPIKKQWIFQVFLASIGILMFFHGNIWFYLSGVGLLITSICPQFERRHSLEASLHVIGATGAVISALIGLWVSSGLWYMLVIPLALALPFRYIKKINVKNKDWWIEILAFVSILTGLVIKNKKNK